MRAITPALAAFVAACGSTEKGSTDARADPVSIHLTAAPPSAPSGGANAILLTATVTRAAGAVPGAAVSFAAPPGVAISTSLATTDASGEATASVTASAAGDFTVTAATAGTRAQIALHFTDAPATALRFALLPASVAVGQSFDVGVTAVDASGHSVSAPGPITLSVRVSYSGAVLNATPNGPGAFKASFDREAIGLYLVATSGALEAQAPAIDVHAGQLADWQLVGAEGAIFPRLLASPSNPEMLASWVSDPGLVQPRNRLSITRDGGASWALAPAAGLPSPSFPDWLSAAWCADGSLYVSAIEGVYRSRDDGASFEQIGNIPGLLSCDGDGARPFLAASQDPPQLLRWDGKEFARASTQLISFIVAAPDGTLFGNSSTGLVRSTDGLTWTPLPHKAGTVRALSASELLMIGIDSVDRSADGGATWTSVLGPGILDIAIAPGGALTALAKDGHLRRSSDGGSTWSEPDGDPPERLWSSLIATAAGTWAVSGRAVYRVDGGAFRLATRGLGGLPVQLLSDSRTGFVYAAYDIGLFRARGGSGWDLVLRGVISQVTFDPANPAGLFVNTGAGVFRSADGGDTWTKVTGAPSAPFVAPDGTTWYAWSDALYRSGDAGATWSRLWQWDVGRPVVTAMMFDGDSVLFSSASDSGKVLRGVFRSDDRGATYVATGVAGGAELLQLGSSVLAPSSVSRTDDFGRTFRPLFPGHPGVNWVASGPGILVAVDQLYGVQPPQLYRSADGGATWTRCRGGLDRLFVRQIEFDPIDGSLYAGTDHGLYRSTNACMAP